MCSTEAMKQNSQHSKIDVNCYLWNEFFFLSRSNETSFQCEQQWKKLHLWDEFGMKKKINIKWNRKKWCRSIVKILLNFWDFSAGVRLKYSYNFCCWLFFFLHSIDSSLSLDYPINMHTPVENGFSCEAKFKYSTSHVFL